MKNKKSELNNMMKASVAIVFAFVLIMPMASVKAGLDENEVWIDISNTTGPWDGSSEHPFRSIYQGIAAVDIGGTVHVRPGTYYVTSSILIPPDYQFSLMINKRISLIGEDRDTTILTSYDVPDAYTQSIIRITVNGVTISGFTISRIYSNYQHIVSGCAIVIDSSDNTISNIMIQRSNDPNYPGIHGKNGNGIGVGGSNNHIYNNIISDYIFSGISVGGSGHTIDHNTITQNMPHNPALLDDSPNDGIFLYGSDNTIEGNTINSFSSCYSMTRDNGAIVLLNANAHDNHILQNNLIGMNFGLNSGIYMDGASNNYIFENTIQNYPNYYDSCGINLQNWWYGNCNTNHIFHNNFIDNVLNAYAYTGCTTVWDDGYLHAGNYWDDHTAFVDEHCGPNQDQTGSVGICDTPYYIHQNLIYDRYPLMQPEVNNYMENIQGTIQYNSFEGGFYGIVSDDVRHFIPQNLPTIYLVDGLRIQFSGRILNLQGNQMWGQGLYITDVHLPILIQVLSPEGDDVYHVGDTMLIQWYSTVTNPVALYISGDGITWGPSSWIANVNNNLGLNTYSLQLSGSFLLAHHIICPTTQCRILIGDNFNNIDMSDSGFSILYHTIQVILPNGGETYHMGDTMQIQWYANVKTLFPDDGNALKHVVDVYISGSSGDQSSKMIKIGRITCDSGFNTYSVRISTSFPISKHCRIVLGVFTPDARTIDISDGDFTILSDLKQVDGSFSGT
jgi:hypothetical protein